MFWLHVTKNSVLLKKKKKSCNNNFEMKTILYLNFLSSLPCCLSLYLSAPVNYCEKLIATETCQSKVPLYVKQLNTEESLISYDYNHFDFCAADDHDSPFENLGQLVFGEKIKSSLYEISFLKDKRCATLCQKTYRVDNKEDIDQLNILKKGILKNYQHHWIIDDMPVTWCYLVEGENRFCSTGFPMGCYVNSIRQPKDACVMNTAYSQPDTFYLFNHVDLYIKYHSGKSESWGGGFKDKGGRIVQVQVRPHSYNHQPEKLCDSAPPMAIPNKLKQDDVITINYTYSVQFVQDNSVKWSSRCDFLLNSVPHENIHWFSILNSLVTIIILMGIITKILLWTLPKDVARYMQIESNDPFGICEKNSAGSEFGWKLIHGDVFRPPQCGMLLSVLLGSGVQIFVTAVITLIFSCFTTLCPDNRRASILTCAMISCVCLSSLAGYVSARIYKAFNGEKWKMNMFLTATVCPGCVFCLFSIMNMILWSEGSSTAISFGTLFILLAFWFGTSLPLTFCGAYFGFKRHRIEYPVKMKEIPRLIPEQPVCRQPILGIMMGGVFPFGCIFTEQYFVLNSIWSSQIYGTFGFPFLVFAMLILICSTTTILLCYAHLCTEDYRWWWRSFLTSGCVSFYFFLYCAYYFMTKLYITGGSSTFLYFGYTLIIVFIFFLLTGTVGFFACFWFVWKIYGIKVD